MSQSFEDQIPEYIFLSIQSCPRAYEQVSLLSTAPSGGEEVREVLTSSPWDPVIGHVEIVQSCTRGGSD